MSNELIVAIVGLIGSLAGSIIGVIGSAKFNYISYHTTGREVQIPVRELHGHGRPSRQNRGPAGCNGRKNQGCKPQD